MTCHFGQYCGGCVYDFSSSDASSGWACYSSSTERIALLVLVILNIVVIVSL